MTRHNHRPVNKYSSFAPSSFHIRYTGGGTSGVQRWWPPLAGVVRLASRRDRSRTLVVPMASRWSHQTSVTPKECLCGRTKMIPDRITLHITESGRLMFHLFEPASPTAVHVIVIRDPAGCVLSAGPYDWNTTPKRRQRGLRPSWLP